MALILPKVAQIKVPSTVGVNALYDAIAPGRKGDEREMIAALSTLSRDDALFACARANAFVTGFDMTVSHAARQETVARWYFTQPQLEALDTFVRRHGGINRTAIFYQGNILELARWIAKYCAHNPEDGETFNDSQARSEFGRAALIATDLWNERLYSGRFGPENSAEEQLKKALGAFRKGSEQSGHAEHTGIAMARAWLLFNHYLPKKLPEFASLFEQATGLTFSAYFTCVCALWMRTFPKHEGGPLFSTEYIKGEQFREEFAKFITLRAQSPEAFADAMWRNFQKNEFRPLRERPILSFSRGRSVILDPSYYTESLTVGPLFDLLKVADNRVVFGAFGYAFEEYILDFLREMFPGSAALPSRLSINVKGKNAAGEEFECDAILNDVNEAFVIEIKASWLREDVVLTNDPEDLIQELLKKYGVTHSGQTSELKGVAQLARSIGAVARREWRGVSRDLEGTKRIFPVLVVHDQRVSYAGVAPYLNLEFLRLLGEMPRTCRVEGLIILTVADIENLASSIENFGFTELLKDYSDAVPNRGISLLSWMSETRYAELVKPPTRLWDVMNSVMEGVKDELMPEGGGTSG